MRGSLVLAAAIACAAPARAQEADVTVSCVLRVSVTVGAVIVLGVSSTAIAGEASSDLLAEAFVRERGRELLADALQGDGGALRDLAAAAGVRTENLPVLARVLRAHRARLAELADPSRLDAARARRLFDLVADWLRGEAPLAADLAEQLARARA